MKISINSIEAFVFDFDGVMTNNLVYVDDSGTESVCCNRADGLAFDVLNKLNKKSFILSSETNPVVRKRADKLKVPAIQGIKNKTIAIKKLANDNNFDLEKIFYVGNDLNDYNAMKACGFSACPANSHHKIKRISTFTLKVKGGDGVIRNLLEDVFNIDFIEILYNS